jgi:deferrochelatase/peroxidase EfeB
MTGKMSRRRLLGATGLASAAVLAGSGSVLAGADTPPQDTGEGLIAFSGPHQAGIATPEQQHVVFATYDVTAASTAGLAALLNGWTTASSRMTAGQEVQGAAGPFAPPPDTGEAVGLPASQLTLTFGFGPSLFDDRFGLAGRRPAALVDLPAFPNDALEPSLTGGDLCIQACANDAQVAFHAVHDLTRLALGSATIRYLQVGFGRTASPGAGQQTPRNLLGFHDGTANLNPADQDAMRQYVWVDHGTDQPWMTGGTYMVVRRIRVHLEEWGRSTLTSQEQTIGRVKSSGAPLGSTNPSDPVNLNALGTYGELVIPNNAHIRVASPALNNGQAILRRGYSFADGVDPQSGELDAGLFFICFQKDPRQQFIPIQTRLAGNDALAEYLLHTGSGVFACPPGAVGGRPLGDTLI